MVPPQTGQFKSELGLSVEGDVAGADMFSDPRSSWKQSGRSVARCRLARKPKLRMRTKPRGSRWSRKRRRNSSTARVMSLFLLPWVESRQRKVTLPSERATSLLLEMATRVIAEIAQHMFRPPERPLGIDDPVVAEQYPQPGSEGAGLGKRQEVAVELERTCMEGVPESGDELAAEDTAEHLDRKKEGAA